MQWCNILENVWGLLYFCAAQLLVNVSLYDVNFVQYKNDKWASAIKREFNNLRMFLCLLLPNAKNLFREINSIYSRYATFSKYCVQILTYII